MSALRFRWFDNTHRITLSRRYSLWTTTTTLNDEFVRWGTKQTSSQTYICSRGDGEREGKIDIKSVSLKLRHNKFPRRFEKKKTRRRRGGKRSTPRPSLRIKSRLRRKRQKNTTREGKIPTKSKHQQQSHCGEKNRQQKNSISSTDKCFGARRRANLLWESQERLARIRGWVWNFAVVQLIWSACQHDNITV